MKHNKAELLLLPKETLVDMIVQLEGRLYGSRRGQPKRDDLVAKTFGALTVVGDAGNQQAHSTWYCRCSGDIYDSAKQGECDRVKRFWGSNLKAGRHCYCGNSSCDASRQVLALKRQKELPVEIFKHKDRFESFLQKQLVQKFAIMGEGSAKDAAAEFGVLTTVLNRYYGLTEEKKAFKIEEINQMLTRNDASDIKRKLIDYMAMYS